MLEAASAAAARQDLRARGLLPVEVAASGREVKPDSGGKSSAFARLFAGIGSRDLTLLTRQLATLIGSGVRIEDALRTVGQQSSPRVASILLNVRAAVLEGRSFGQALADYPAVFSEYYRASITAGEQSGQLDQVMRHLATFVEGRSRNAQSVQLALLYPALLATVSLGIIIMLMTYVMPDIIRVFTSRGADLPLLTRALIVLSEALRAYGLAALVGLVVGAPGLPPLAAHAGEPHPPSTACSPRAASPPATSPASTPRSSPARSPRWCRARVPLVEALAAASRRHPQPLRPPAASRPPPFASARARASATRSAPPRSSRRC